MVQIFKMQMAETLLLLISCKNDQLHFKKIKSLHTPSHGLLDEFWRSESQLRSFQHNSLNPKKHLLVILNLSVSESRLYLILKFLLKGIIILMI